MLLQLLLLLLLQDVDLKMVGILVMVVTEVDYLSVFGIAFGGYLWLYVYLCVLPLQVSD